ncbi:unnamed protein product [Menidia menidia]|uniref:(Atlantic silverside) hypothetical protein n=1 Tax=Menidia menidia TaxID=238744 RepID=A0A8S4AH63_9TELE|nr:unnamed protein product [Menidia menidia]
MSTNKTKKVKMATKSCPECDQQIPVACKSCPCGYVFISRKLLNAKLSECSSPAIAAGQAGSHWHLLLTLENMTNGGVAIIVLDMLDFKRRRTERIRKERIDSPLTSDMENRRRPRANNQSDTIRRGRGRPKTKDQRGQREKQEKEVDIYAGLSDEKAFVFSVALAEINRKILGQRLIL